MAAFELFQSYNGSLSDEERTRLKDRIGSEWQELLAARSEDARTRLVHEYIREVHETLHHIKR